MSVNNSIANCRKSFAHGSSRQVFYSKKYDLIIKKPYPAGWNWAGANDQTMTEREMFMEMTPEERAFFPIVGFTTDNNGDEVVLMKKIDGTLDDLGCGYPFMECLELMSSRRQQEELMNVKREFGLKFSVAAFMRLIKKYNIKDLHSQNLGIYNNRVVIIDFGW